MNTNDVTNAKVYVTCIDKALSGWGFARGRKNKLVFLCESRQEAEVVAANARARKDQRNVRITTRMPRMSDDRFYTQVKSKSDYPSWYKPGWF